MKKYLDKQRAIISAIIGLVIGYTGYISMLNNGQGVNIGYCILTGTTFFIFTYLALTLSSIFNKPKNKEAQETEKKPVNNKSKKKKKKKRKN